MSMRTAVRLLAVGLATVLAAGGVRAQVTLFADNEARRAINELRTRVQEGEAALQARIAEQAAAARADQAAQTAQLGEQLAALRRSLLELNNQIEATRAEIARLRGASEVVLRDVSEATRRQQEQAQALDERIRKLEPVRVALDGQEFTALPEEKRQYEEAVGVMRGGAFDKAAVAFGQFLRRWPGSGYTELVRFWQANALYGKRDYAQAIAAFRAFVADAPQHPRAPEAMLALANSQAETKDVRGARKTIEDLMKAYPQSEAAQAGKERLASLR